ncbi:MAG: hypothetical protein WBG46_12875 [Nonlabens sp.]
MKQKSNSHKITVFPRGEDKSWVLSAAKNTPKKNNTSTPITYRHFPQVKPKPSSQEKKIKKPSQLPSSLEGR